MISTCTFHIVLVATPPPFLPLPRRALSAFDAGDLSLCREYVELQSEGRRDPDVFPLWDPAQLLATSQLLMLKAATHQTAVGEEGSGSDETTSVASEGEYGTAK